MLHLVALVDPKQENLGPFSLRLQAGISSVITLRAGLLSAVFVSQQVETLTWFLQVKQSTCGGGGGGRGVAV